MKYFFFSLIIHFSSLVIIMYKINPNYIFIPNDYIPEIISEDNSKIYEIKSKTLEKENDHINVECIKKDENDNINEKMIEQNNLKNLEENSININQKEKTNIISLKNSENNIEVSNKHKEKKIYNFKNEKILFNKIKKLLFIEKNIRNKNKYIEVLIILDEKGKIKSFRFINTFSENKDYYNSLRKLLNSKLLNDYTNKDLQNKKLLFKFNCA